MRGAVSVMMALGALAAGCTTIFDSDFETEAAGAAPLYDRPGPPPGDTIDRHANRNAHRRSGGRFRL